MHTSPVNRCCSSIARDAGVGLMVLAAAISIPCTPARAQIELPQDEIIYQIMPIAWRDSNNDTQGATQTRFGDFGGLASMPSLDYLQNLGVTMIYLQPIFPSAAYHGYQHGPANQLNTRFGTEAEFLALVNAAHARGMKVILDYVAYGISHNSIYYTSAFNNPASVYDQWLAFTNSANTQYVGSTYNTWNGASVGFIHWNLANAGAVNAVTTWARHWLDPNNDGNTSDGVDGFRLDHAYANAPEGWGANIGFWQTWCSSLRSIKPGIFIFCEHGDWGNYGTEMLTPTGFDAVLTKPFEFAARDAVANETAGGLYASVAATVAATPSGKVVIAQTNDHDSDRLASVLGGSNAKQKVAAAVLMTQPFPPNIYFGDELGMRGIKGNWGSDANDIPMREPFKWSAVHAAPMTNYWILNSSAYNNRTAQNNDGRSVQEQQGVAGSVLETYRALIAARTGSVALRRGSYVPVTNTSSRVFAFVRSHADQTVLVAINLGAAQVTTSLNLSDFGVVGGSTVPMDLVTGAVRPAITTANRAAYSLTLPGYSYAIATVGLTFTPPPPDIDGRFIPADSGAANLLATQTCATNMGNNTAELNQMFLRPADDGLRLSVTGNAPTDGTALLVLLQTNAGGQNVLNTASLAPPPAGLQTISGTSLDNGFAPDHMFFLNFYNGAIYVDQVVLSASGAFKTYRGQGFTNSGQGAITGGDNPNGLLVALDNTNTLGVTASSVAGASSATTGLEMRIPYADVGLPALPQDRAGRTVRVASAIVRSNGTFGNQWLPGIPAGSGDLGLDPAMTGIAGQQFASLTLPPATTGCDSIDFNADGLLPDTLDVDDFLSVFSGGPCSTGACGDIDFNNDGLFPDTQDVDALLSVFSGGACV